VLHWQEQYNFTLHSFGESRKIYTRISKEEIHADFVSTAIEFFVLFFASFPSGNDCKAMLFARPVRVQSGEKNYVILAC
jgi:hypothetical protein